MTEIYSILELAIMFLVVDYILLFTIIPFVKKKSNDNIRVIKTRIVFASILLVVFIIMMITALVLGKPIVKELINAILWAIYTTTECNKLKVVKRSINYDSHIMSDFRNINYDKIIDGEYREITDEEETNNH